MTMALVDAPPRIVAKDAVSIEVSIRGYVRVNVPIDACEQSLTVDNPDASLLAA